MIYAIIIFVTIINIFNISLIASNNVEQVKKEKVLLVTYSLVECAYMIFSIFLMDYTPASMVLIISFIIIWLLSKAYILTVNMKFDNIKWEGICDMQENDMTDINQVEVLNDEAEEINVVTEVSPDKLDFIENNEVNEVKEEIDDVEKNIIDEKEEVLTPNSLHTMLDILSTNEVKERQERQTRRRSLALKISKINNDDK